MRRTLRLAPVLLVPVLLTGSRPPRQAPPVRLAVVVVVDQLRADLLDRYDDLFTGGFRRLRDRGFRFTQATQDHAWTETAPGHAAIATGTVPAHNGIVLNDFFVRDGDRVRSLYSVADSASPILGLPDLPGRSPANMRRPAFSEWLVANEPKARIATVSRKDRGAIPLAGHTHATALWMDIEAGRFVTSRYYATAYPAWVDDFNTRVLPVLYADSVWVLRVPPAAIARARPDSADYENGGKDVTFPHAASERGRLSYNAWVAKTPVPDIATLAMAHRMAEELHLGRQDHLDFLGISLSQTDAIGHAWGPLSLEQLDNLLRLDRALGEFMEWLDEFVGRDQWVLALSADHGVMTAPEYLAQQGIDAHRLTVEDSRAQRAILNRLTGSVDAATRAAVVADLERLPFVADVVTIDELRDTVAVADSFIRLYRNSYAPDRGTRSQLADGLVIQNRVNIIPAAADAATHGSAYYYDRHVPLAFMGPGIRAGVTQEPARAVDLAPTLAGLLGVPVPAGVDGVSLVATLRQGAH
jgi:predicted AlkP superfamily pyrophosphatase or phosphodiesterase